MANLDAAFGLNPVGSISGGANQKLNEYKIASNEANAIFQGDMVQPDSGNIQQAGTGTTNIGVFGVVNSMTQQLTNQLLKTSLQQAETEL